MSHPLHKLLSPSYAYKKISDFLHFEAAGGICLMFTAFLALLFANSFAAEHYFSFARLSAHWVNDGLMAIFFFLVGLEIKSEFTTGRLAKRQQAILPVIAAIGGMAIPALLFVAVNIDHPENIRGWAIPSATDIAFSLGVLALLGSRVPISAKVLLTAIAIIDDLGAILIIAFFYTAELDLAALAIAALSIGVLFTMNKTGKTSLPAYLVVGALLWVGLYKGGVHPTLAGVLTALALPGDNTKLEHTLHPYVAFIILPIFAFVNAGVPLAGLNASVLLEPVTLGIILGLLVGKPIGIAGFTWLAHKTRIIRKPVDLSWGEIIGIAALCGIGFTMSLFIGDLAYADATRHAEIRIGVLTASIASAILGYFLIKISSPPAQKP